MEIAFSRPGVCNGLRMTLESAPNEALVKLASVKNGKRIPLESGPECSKRALTRNKCNSAINGLVHA